VLRGMPVYQSRRDFIPIVSELVQSTHFARHGAN
jgi:hypothetical protein